MKRADTCRSFFYRLDDDVSTDGHSPAQIEKAIAYAKTNARPSHLH